MMSRPVALAVAGLALCLLGGCYPIGDPQVEPTFPADPLNRYPLAELTDPAVLEFCPALPAQHFEGFTAHEVVYICRGDEHRATDGTSTYGPWETVYRVVDPASLLESYAQPDDTRIVLACPDGDLDPLILWVHAGGVVTPVYAPVNGCGYARGEMVDAYQQAQRELILEVDTNGPLDEHDTPAEH